MPALRGQRLAGPGKGNCGCSAQLLSPRHAPPCVAPLPSCRLAGHVCHSCFRPLSQPVENKEGFNPCLPRYCVVCKKAEASVGACCGGMAARSCSVVKYW